MFGSKWLYFFAALHHGVAASVGASALGPVLPGNDAFYSPPAGFEDKKPGTILRNRKVPATLAISGVSAAHQILYRTTNTFGNATAVVTTILVPNNADNTKLLSYQVAEDAACVNCAPSYVMQLFSQSGGPFGTIVTTVELGFIQQALKKGWYVAVPDFLGPKSAFLANTLAGYAVLDGIRAALSSSDFTKLANDPAIALWGYSGGSMASGFAAELQPTYAPELKIAGAALGGTIPSILNVLYKINKTFFAGLIATGIIGLGNEYPEVASLIASEIVPNKVPVIEKLSNLCLGAVVLDVAFQDIFTYTKDPAVFNSTLVKTVADANSPGHYTPNIPLLIYKGAKDQISPVEDTDNLVQKYCSEGASVDYRRVPGADHIALIFSGVQGALTWLNDRLSGTPVQQGCTNSTQI